MKKIIRIFFAFLLLHPNINFAQNPSYEWSKSVNYNSGVTPNRMAIDSYGGLYTCGHFVGSSTNSVEFENTSLSGSNVGYDNSYLAKYNSNGYLAWAVQPLKGSTLSSSYDYINGIAVDLTGNSYVTGLFFSEHLIFHFDTLKNSTSSDDIFLAKYDAGGNALWALSLQNMGGTSGQECTAIAIDNEGYIYCSGNFYNDSLLIHYKHNNSISDTIIPNSGNGVQNNNADIFLIKYTADGDLVWANKYGGADVTESSSCMAIDANNNILIGGYMMSGTAILGIDSLTSKGKTDGIIMKLDPNGNVLWANQVGSTNEDRIYAVKANNNIYLTGYFTADLSCGKDTLTNNNSSQDIFLIKLDSLGSIIWAKSFAGNGDDYPFELSLDNNNEGILLSGLYLSSSIVIGNDTLQNNGSYGTRDIFLAKIDSIGNEKWAVPIGGNDYEDLPSIAYGSGQHFYLTGSFNSQSMVLGSNTLVNSNSIFNLFITALIDNDTTGNISEDTTSTTLVYELNNGGLYGGSSADLTYSQTGNRLFSGIETPASLFISDDNATTWYQAFDNDSLEDASESKGWSGKATRIVGNQKGWVAVQTNHPKLKYSSAVISYSNGDTNTWQTVVDPVRLTEWGFASHHVSAIALSDYYLMAALGPFIVKKDSGKINPLTDVMSILTTTFNFPLTSTINSIALSNNANAYPFYIAIDESGDENGYNRRLLKYDGTNFTELTLPSSLNGIRAVFTHPAQTTADTLFITAMDVNTNAYKIYKSFDAGNNWTDISYSSATDFLSDVDYSANWNLSASNNSILIIPGNAISKDMGSTWDTLGTDHTANAIDPANVNTIVGSGKSIEISTGTTLSFTKTTSYGLAALEVNKIARTENKSVFYIATKTGLGYTTAYLDTNLTAGQKWETPYGVFPLITDTINFGSVAIDPTDSLHVIAGSPYGFYTTKTGYNGFSAITPSNFSTNNPQVKDIAILNNNIAIAVSGGDSTYDAGKGKIWRTSDGGLTWTDIYSPTNFSNGNSIALGYGKDTVIYIGSGLMNVDKGYLWKSNDKGITWNKINNGPTSMAGTSIQGLPINDIEVDPRGTDTLYIAAGYENEYAFILSMDGGSSYIYINNFSGNPFTSIAINNDNPDTVYEASGREIYLYDLANNNSRFMFRLLPDERIPDLMSGSIIAATTTGLYTYRPTWEDDLDSGIIVNNAIKMVNNNEMTVFPNPFTDEATIKLYLKENSKVSIEMYDLMGQKIESIFSGSCKQGYSNYQIASHNLPSGSYLLYANVNDLPYRKLLYHVR